MKNDAYDAFLERERGDPGIVPFPSHAPAEPPPAPFLILSPAEARIDTACERYLVKKVFNRSDVGVMFGESGSGKTFLALSLARHIAAGRDWLDMRVRQAPALYISLEGHEGFHKRVRALEEGGGFDPADPFRFACANGSDFANPQYRKNVVTQTKAGGFGLVVIDTLSRFLGEADENTNVGMGQAIAFADEIKRETGAAVLFVHHTGKDVSRGERGHNSLRGNLDFRIAVERHENVRSLSFLKVKDDEDGQRFEFDLQRVELAIDVEGDPITSCVITDTRSAGEKRKELAHRKPTPTQTKFWQIVKAHIEEHGERRKVEADIAPVLATQRHALYEVLRREGWLDNVGSEGEALPNDAPTTSGERGKVLTQLKGLHGRELLNFNKEWVWLCD